MTRIDKLTDKQLARLPAYASEWTDIGLSTQPADRPRAEAAIRWMYRQAKLTEPRIVWCGSPLANGLTRAIVQQAASVSCGLTGRSRRTCSMTEAWRLSSEDEMSIELENCDCYVDRVCSKPEDPEFRLANVTFVTPGITASIVDLEPCDLRNMAALLADFAELLERPAPTEIQEPTS